MGSRRTGEVTVTSRKPRPPNVRIAQLANDIMESDVEPGPLDREDIHEALCELLELRARYEYEQGEDVPTLRAAS
jgi:hypothetical protein